MENNITIRGFVSVAPQSIFGLPVSPVVVQVSSPAQETETPAPAAPKAEDTAMVVAKAIAADQERRQKAAKKEHNLTVANLGYRLMGASIRNLEKGMPFGAAALRACKWMRILIDEDASLQSHDARKPLRDFISAVEAAAHPPFTPERISDMVAKRAKTEEKRGAKPGEAVREAVGWVKRAIWRDTLRITNAKERDPLLAAANACLPPKPAKAQGKQKAKAPRTPMEDVRKAFATCPADKRLACAQAFIHRCVESTRLSDQEKSSVMTLIEDEVRKHFKAPVIAGPTTLAEVEAAEAEARRWVDSKIEYARKKASPKAPKAKGNSGNRQHPRPQQAEAEAPPRDAGPKVCIGAQEQRMSEINERLRLLGIALRGAGSADSQLFAPFAEEYESLKKELEELHVAKAEQAAAAKAERIRRAEASAEASRELPKSLLETPAESRKRHREKAEAKAAKAAKDGGKKGKGGKKG